MQEKTFRTIIVLWLGVITGLSLLNIVFWNWESYRYRDYEWVQIGMTKEKLLDLWSEKDYKSIELGNDAEIPSRFPKYFTTLDKGELIYSYDFWYPAIMYVYIDENGFVQNTYYERG